MFSHFNQKFIGFMILKMYNSLKKSDDENKYFRFPYQNTDHVNSSGQKVRIFIFCLFFASNEAQDVL